MTDPLTPEDRALYDAFFVAYGEKHRELSALGPEVSLDACTVHAIKAMVRKEVAFQIERLPFGQATRLAGAEFTKSLEAQVQATAPGEKLDLDLAMRRATLSTLGVWIEFMTGQPPASLADVEEEQTAPRIVEAVGHGVRVKRDDEESVS